MLVIIVNSHSGQYHSHIQENVLLNQVKLLIHLSSVVRSNNTLKIMMLKMMPLEKDRFKEIINSAPFLSHSPHTTTGTTSNQF